MDIHVTLLASNGPAVLSSEIPAELFAETLQGLGLDKHLADGTRKIVSEVSEDFDAAYAELGNTNSPDDDVLERWLLDITQVMAANPTARFIVNVY